MTDIQAENGPAKAVSHLSEQLAQTAECQRAFITEVTTFTKDESMRFLNLRMDRNSQALSKLQSAQGLSGLFGVQQEWLRDLMQDYTEFSQRNAQAFRDMSQTVAAKCADAASQTVDRIQAQAKDSVRQGAQMMSEAQDRTEAAMHQAGEQANNFVQDQNNNWQH